MLLTIVSVASNTARTINLLPCTDNLCNPARVSIANQLEWTRNLPCFATLSDLNASSEWRGYVHRVYGHLQDDDFPMDLRCFSFWWRDLLPHGIKNRIFVPHLTRNRKHPRNGELVELGDGAWQIYSLENRSYLLPQHSHTRVEIYHDYDDCLHADKQPGGVIAQVGFWAHYAPGSGVFANLGSTLSVTGRGYGEVCRAVLGDSPRCTACCTPTHKIVRTLMLERGYDSTQSCCAPRGGTFDRKMHELTFWRPTCTPHGDHCPSILEAGRRTPRPCVCNTINGTRCLLSLPAL